MTGAKGPEFEAWANVPLRQHARVSFFCVKEARFDVWEFQRQFVLANKECEHDWNVSNINDILEDV
jgi:hypothetical protein